MAIDILMSGQTQEQAAYLHRACRAALINEPTFFPGAGSGTDGPARNNRPWRPKAVWRRAGVTRPRDVPPLPHCATAGDIWRQAVPPSGGDSNRLSGRRTRRPTQLG